ncbi:ATP-binding protein [Pseudomonas sp. MWU16-30317]|uniref:sensor histidine kinase n=1 Tax=Pseudomonas sp. MWU16-30317 TaxID=2878095 RepID=UPI001CFB4426|nr:ATP-binding protein [Pseudomonas sp. MWU16-30317]
MPGDDAFIPDAETLYRHASCALLVTNRAGLILKVNQTFCTWLGYNSEALVNKRRIQELLTVGGRMFHQTHWVPLLEMQRSVAEIQFDFKASNGRLVPMVVNASRREHDGHLYDEISAIVIAQRHLFEQELKGAKRQAESALEEHLVLQRELSVADARLRIALESAQLYVWDVDLQTMERRYDPGVARLLGFNSPQPITEAAYNSFIDPADVAQERQLFQAAMESPGHTYRCVYRLNGVDGSPRTVLATGRGVADANQALLQFVGVLHDITEVSLQRMMAEDRAVFAEQMIGIVSHDLRNPLQIISMATQRIETSRQPSDQITMLGHVREATHRAQRLINDLLDFTQARIGQGLSINPADVVVKDVLQMAVEALRFANPGRQIILVVDAARHFHLDIDRITQLLGNLISNAMTYGAADTPVTVNARLDAAELVISVHNQGDPIPTTLMPTLFTPMTRGTGVGQVVRSVGLGLYIVSEIAKAHGGTVGVTSCSGAGTTFSVRLPAQF